jgi:hypothetical protein
MIRERSEIGSEKRRLRTGRRSEVYLYLHKLTGEGREFFTVWWNMSLPTATVRVQSRGNVQFPALVITAAEFIVPDWGDKVDYGIWVLYRPARLYRHAGRYDNPYAMVDFNPPVID